MCLFFHCYGTLLKLCPPHDEICLPAPPQSLLFLSFILPFLFFSFLFFSGMYSRGARRGGWSLERVGATVWGGLQGASQCSQSHRQSTHTHTQGVAPPTHPATVRRRGKWMCATALPRPGAFSEALKTHILRESAGSSTTYAFFLEIYAQHLMIYHALIYIEQSTSQFSLCVE